jgi:hypothetical protein
MRGSDAARLSQPYEGDPNSPGPGPAKALGVDTPTWSQLETSILDDTALTMNVASHLTDEGYTLRYGAAATAVVKSSLHLAVRPHLQDVRAMLRLPLPEVGITAGCNFAAVHVLLNVLSGLSRLLGPGPTRSDAAFRKFVARWYPWQMEPRRSSFRQKRGTEALNDLFRTGFSHDLGLLLESGPVDHRGRIRPKFRIAGRRLGVTKQPSLSPALLVELDGVTLRPNWLGPTIVADGKVGMLVAAVALYWGVRRLVFDHTSNRRAVSSLHKMIEDSWKRRKAAGLIVTIEAANPANCWSTGSRRHLERGHHSVWQSVSWRGRRHLRLDR